MARIVEGPWFRQGKNTWYATIGGRAVSLGVQGKSNRQAAWAEYLRRTGAGEPAAGPPLPSQAESFLAASTHLKATTLRIYGLDVRAFAKWEGVRGKTAADVRPSHVQAWAASLKVADTTKAMSIRSVGAFFGWLVRDGVLEANPVRRVVKPKGRKRGREAVLAPGVYAALLAAATPEFADVLRFLRGTGCRPGEVGQVTAAAYDPAHRVVTVEEHKTDRDGHARAIFLDEETAVVVAGLAARFPEGPVFRTYKGTVWTGRAITEAMRKTCRRAKVRARAYDFRHTFVTEALLSGESDVVVAALVGHASPATIHANYSHVSARAQQLSRAAEELRKKRAG